MISRIRVVVGRSGERGGFLAARGLTVRCALGRAGLTSDKREGDGATPAGILRPLAVLYRPDRGARPQTGLPVGVIRPDSGWCDDPGDHAYNRPVRLPYPGRHEKLWRSDRLYDVIVVLDYNVAPAIRGAGSAIFLHIARQDFAPTEGCIAVAPQGMRQLLARIDRRTTIIVR